MDNVNPNVPNRSYVAPLLVLIGLATCWLAFIHTHMVDIPYWDQWDFFKPMFESDNLWEMFRYQHGPHRMGVGLWQTSLVAWLTDWNMRAEAFGVAMMMILCALLALGLKRALVGSWHISDVFIPILFLRPTIWNVATFTPNPAHGAWPLFLLLLLAAWLRLQRSKSYYFGFAALYLALVFTGFGLVVAPLTFVLLAQDIREPRQSRLFATVATGCVFLFTCLFFVGYQSQPAADCFVFPDNPLKYFNFSAILFSAGVGGFSRNDKFHAVGVLLFLSVLFVIYRSLRNRQDPLAVLGAFAVVFALLTAVGRVCQGYHAALSPRYQPYIIPGVFALYLFLLRFNSGRLKHLRWILVVTAVGFESIFAPVSLQRDFAEQTNRLRWKQCYLERGHGAQCDALTNYKVYPDANAIRSRLDFLRANGYSLFRQESAGQPATLPVK